MSELSTIGRALVRIADCLERIEKVLPGCNREALRDEVKEILTALLSCENTPVEYK